MTASVFDHTGNYEQCFAECGQPTECVKRVARILRLLAATQMMNKSAHTTYCAPEQLMNHDYTYKIVY